MSALPPPEDDRSTLNVGPLIFGMLLGAAVYAIGAAVFAPSFLAFLFWFVVMWIALVMAMKVWEDIRGE